MYIAKPLSIDPVHAKDSPERKAAEARKEAAAKSAAAGGSGGGARKLFSRRPSLGKSKDAAVPQVPKEEIVDEAALAEVARKLHGFSGREISKLFTSLQTHVLYSSQGAEHGHFRLSKSMLFEVVGAKVQEHDRCADFQVRGYNYENTEQKLYSNGPSPMPTPTLNARPGPCFARGHTPVSQPAA
mmetsp:Transcript_51353/g.116209  ORF Transcript_51353/g.116209 Transcript_51353/m.116209 type:complete len:185 (-) Transcript_51353:108-662(-)